MGKTIKTIEDLKPDPMNANRGTPRGHGIIEHSIRKHGAGRPGLAAKDGTMIAGSQTLEEMAALGFEIVPIHTTGKQWPVHIRDDIEPGSPEAVEMAIEDNRAAQVGISWDPTILAELPESVDLSPLFFPHEIAALLEQAGTEILDANELWKGMPEFEYNAKAFKSIAVHFANEADYEAFARLINQSLTTQTRYIWYPYREKDNLKDLRYEREE